MKIKIGIIFGGNSKEREISFSGGRTVYDNLNKSLFEPVPVFVDSFGNFILLDWQFIYKGTIRDFYPAVESLDASKGNDFQVYAESLGALTSQQQEALIDKIGKKIPIEALSHTFDFAFLCLHGTNGEDGKIQGLLAYLHIPYSGSGILPSAIGMNKAVQKKFMVNAGFASPNYTLIKRQNWIADKKTQLYNEVKSNHAPTLVVKAANQGSSIGISILTDPKEPDFIAAVNKSFFIRELSGSYWEALSNEARMIYIRQLADIREGIGIPVKIGRELFYHPADLLAYLNKTLTGKSSVLIEALDGESEVIVEEFIEGKEFSCIVIQDENGKSIALPPTEIRKGKELFDYRSKYMPGLSRKITPIDLPSDIINQIRNLCERLFEALQFNVYARIDGFIKSDGTIFLNDPNTTSGMMPSSFFFHQAAEIGLNPSNFLTFIIRTSLAQCSIASNNYYEQLLARLDKQILDDKSALAQKTKVAVLLGGYSSERHISVESGRNIYEKLASSTKYDPIPVFLTGNADEHIMYQLPINILLKDNADDIKEKIENYHVHEVIQQVITACASITAKYGSSANLAKPKRLTYADLAEQVAAVFIALHGRPGEDGAVQAFLEQVNLPYNGSNVQSSALTIDKYRTNELLKRNGFLVAEHLLVTQEDWNRDKSAVLATLTKTIGYPFIAKPVDDGCSSAVRKIKSVAEFESFARLIFRTTSELDSRAAEILQIKPKEEFPNKNVLLVEELITRKDAKHFLEVTGGMLTSFDQEGNITYELFEASEALAEGEILSLEEKFLAGQGQNITPARYAFDPAERQKISEHVKQVLGNVARLLNINGYARIDAFVRVYADKVEVILIEVNSLPGMTPATCIFHQAAINGYKPYDFIDKILEFAINRNKLAFNKVKN